MLTLYTHHPSLVSCARPRSAYPVHPSAPGRRSFTPRIDIVEKDGDIYLRAELPGVDKSDVRVEVEDNQLFLTGEKRLGGDDADKQLQRERSAGRFARTFNLPRTVDAQAIEASYKDGVLTVKLPRSGDAKPRRIDVN